MTIAEMVPGSASQCTMILFLSLICKETENVKRELLWGANCLVSVMASILKCY